MTHQPAPATTSLQTELAAIAEDLHLLSDRLDRVDADVTVGDGLAAMSVDVASQAVHLALVELEGFLVPAA